MKVVELRHSELPRGKDTGFALPSSCRAGFPACFLRPAVSVFRPSSYEVEECPMRVSHLLRRTGVVFFVAALALLCVHLLSPPLYAQAIKPAVGSAGQCAACHEDQVKQFATTRHGKADTYKAWGFAESCASCHGDATAHMESADPSKIRNPRKLSTAEASGTCLKCHGNQHVQSFWQGSQH